MSIQSAPGVEPYPQPSRYADLPDSAASWTSVTHADDVNIDQVVRCVVITNNAVSVRLVAAPDGSSTGIRLGRYRPIHLLKLPGQQVYVKVGGTDAVGSVTSWESE